MKKSGVVLGIGSIFVMLFLIVGNQYNSSTTQLDIDRNLIAKSVVLDGITQYPDKNEIIFNSIINTTQTTIVESVTTPKDEIVIGLKVKKTDSAGVTKTEEFLTEPIPIIYGFLTEENGFTDFQKGKLEFSLFVKSKPNFEFDLEGEGQVVINGQVITGATNKFSGAGFTDKNGIGYLSFASNNGFMTVSLENMIPYLKKGPNEIQLVLAKLTMLKSPFTNAATLPDQVIYKIKFDYDESKIIITGENGNPVKAYDTDISFAVSSFATYSNIYRDCASSTKGQCMQYIVHYCGGNSAPSIGAITIKEKATDKIIGKSNYYPNNGGRHSTGFQGYTECRGGGWDSLGGIILDVKLQRNNQYLVEIGSPQNTKFEIHTPETKKTYYIKCSAETGQDACNNQFKTSLLQ